MNTFYLYEGQNEAGPFTLDELKQKRITRTTPVRQKDSDKWFPAETLAELKTQLVPRKIKRPKDVVPAVAEHFSDWHYRKPMALYGALLGIAMLSCFSFYELGRTTKEEAAQASVPAGTLPATASHDSINNTSVAAKPSKEGISTAKTTAPKDDAARAARLRWNKLISATNSNYGIGLFGGIKDLSVIVNNRTDYPLDEVITKVTYIKASGDVWKTKLITMYAVQAGDSKDQSVPDVGRGKKAKVSIYKVVSHKMKFSYTEGKRGSDSSDPYYKE